MTTTTVNVRYMAEFACNNSCDNMQRQAAFLGPTHVTRIILIITDQPRCLLNTRQAAHYRWGMPRTTTHSNNNNKADCKWTPLTPSPQHQEQIDFVSVGASKHWGNSRSHSNNLLMQQICTSAKSSVHMRQQQYVVVTALASACVVERYLEALGRNAAVRKTNKCIRSWS